MQPGSSKTDAKLRKTVYLVEFRTLDSKNSYSTKFELLYHRNKVIKAFEALTVIQIIVLTPQIILPLTSKLKILI